MGFLGLLRKARGVFLAMLIVFAAGTSAGYMAGKKGWADGPRMRTSPLFQLNRNLELKVPVYGTLLDRYKTWERGKLMGYVFQGRAVKAMFLVFFNNWVVADFTMIVRTVTLAPLLLYPYGRFLQGLTLAQNPAGLRVWTVWMTEFGGYFLTICAVLSAVLWVLAFRRFGFPSRRKALAGGLKVFAAAYLVSGVFFFIGAYAEMLLLLGTSFR